MLIVGSSWADGPDAADGDDAASAPPPEHVVLLHGLARTKFSMSAMALALEEQGFTTTNIDYPSTRLEAEQLGGMLGERLDACCREAETVHFVTHSMGGIVVRAYLAEHDMPNLGRVVMLAPPNQGSEWVDELRDLAVFEWVMGPSAVELGTDPASLPNRLPEATYPLGVIAGTEVANPIGGELIPGEDDGTVSVASTQLEGMADFLVLPVSHTFIMYSDDVAKQVVTFLRTGRFDHTVPAVDGELRHEEDGAR